MNTQVKMNSNENESEGDKDININNTKIHPHLQSVFLILLGQVGIDDKVEQRARDSWLGALLLEERRNVSAVHSEEVHRPRVVALHRLVGNGGGESGVTNDDKLVDRRENDRQRRNY